MAKLDYGKLTGFLKGEQSAVVASIMRNLTASSAAQDRHSDCRKVPNNWCVDTLAAAPRRYACRKAYAKFSMLDMHDDMRLGPIKMRQGAAVPCEGEIHQWLLAATRRRSGALSHPGLRRHPRI